MFYIANLGLHSSKGNGNAANAKVDLRVEVANHSSRQFGRRSHGWSRWKSIYLWWKRPLKCFYRVGNEAGWEKKRQEKRRSTAKRHFSDLSLFTCCTVTFSTSQGGKCDRERTHWHIGLLLLQSRWRPQSWEPYWAHAHPHRKKRIWQWPD